MHWIDISVFVIYMCTMLGIGFFFLHKNKNADDYYVGGRNMGSLHIGLSVVATDVGGGFSIGLGGLGFVMGLAGSWMLFTGLIGAWLSAVFLIPRITKMKSFKELYTFPQIFEKFYNGKVALIAGIISAIGYIGFTSSQVLAGAKLASASFVDLNLNTALYIMGAIVVIYTFLGGIKAVIYTDTVQWIILMVGLIFIGIPLSYNAIGGYGAISAALPDDYMSLGNVSWQTLVNWTVTIIPIWFVGMTLYQRIFACRSEKEAKRAWFIAGIFEYPIMAFMGVMLGLFSRVAAEDGMFAYLGFATIAEMDSEMGLPMLLRTILPVGLMGLMMSAYFSAIMSTADSCLMAASGNVITDILDRFFPVTENHKRFLRISQFTTLLLGGFAIMLATSMQNVLELMLYSYAFMVSGLFVPIIGALFWKRSSSIAAFWAMLLGGGTTITLIAASFDLPLDLDANIFGISVSAITFFLFSYIFPNKEERESVYND
ncbi:MAG: sodium:solute symporter family protein [Melioribacteraceae bacterium]|nr:sodium:solute symporter family protein [Melioribacteraceae bacterium]MCF8354727.1 sodium:solute symporter family protein [Melioribacteraceae bacterium]MCF8394356.1 sodium:solute symporter family protein [Melioribacteraceae bacterium]MCF8420066.1 sodium:solute symporter family protein [Melioribacteraceae bacterium]